MSIIERDIEFYRGEVERLTGCLIRCRVEHEPHYQARRDAAKAIVAALEKYKATTLS